MELERISINSLDEMVNTGLRNLPDWIHSSLEQGIIEGFRRGNIVIGAFHKQQLIGWINIKPRIYNGINIMDIPVFLILLLVVQKSYQRRGIGTSLIKKLIDNPSVTRIAAYVPLSNNPYREFLEKMRFNFVAYQKCWFKNGEDVGLYVYGMNYNEIKDF